MRIAVTGASGLIGSALAPRLREKGHEVVRLVRRQARAPDEVQWDPDGGTLDDAALGSVDAIVHLAGETIGRRWSTERRRRIRESRLRGTRLVAEAVAARDPRPVLLCASAVGYYGQRGDERLTEASPAGDGFLAEVVAAWESAADPAREAGARVVHLRQAPVLARQGGMLEPMLLPFKLGLGGRVGRGDQWWSWVTLDDVVAAYLFALERPLAGAFNLVAPGVVRNREFVDTLGEVLHRPTVFPLPGTAVKLVWGEMGAEMLLGGQRAVPERLLGEGFTFAYPELRPALEHVLRG
ncbi:MAG TPA: TIGR01777 family oxidoreductase [Gaiella sp.]|nr:TIGR01777 family oxidoreductase [Gaiella sp.]